MVTARWYTVLPGIANSSLTVVWFRNQYRQVRKVTGKWVHDFGRHCC